MSSHLNATLTSLKNGGYEEASLAMSENAEAGWSAFDTPGKTFCLGDGSSQVPNLRASEIFCALWAAHKYPESEVHTDIMQTGTVGQFAHHWGPWNPLDARVDEWLEFYSPHKRCLNLLSLAPMSAVQFSKGGLVVQRIKALWRLAGLLNGTLGFDTAKVVKRIKVIEFLEEAHSKGVTLGQVSANVPAKKAIGTWTCPCCAVRISLRHNGNKYYVTDSYGNPAPKGCWGSQVVSAQVADSMSFSQLVRVTGIELNFFASAGLYDVLGHKDSVILIRDYSNPRGSVAEVLRQYGKRVRLTTRNYLLGSDGYSEMTFDELCAAASSNPRHLVEYMNLYPLISNGNCVKLQLKNCG